MQIEAIVVAGCPAWLPTRWQRPRLACDFWRISALSRRAAREHPGLRRIRSLARILLNHRL